MRREDLEKIIKCLNLLSSNQDGEVIAAAKMAVKLLKVTNNTWETVVGDSEALVAKIKKLERDFRGMKELAASYKWKYEVADSEYRKLRTKPYWKKVVGL